jgi:hypothetical protein
MRNVIVAAVLAALGSVALAVPATASFDHHFTVLEKARFHVLSNQELFTIRGGLFDPLNHDNRVGSDHGRCKIRPHEVLMCRGIMHLNGEIGGGSGDIKYRGNVRPDDSRLNVTGGSGDFNGVAGKWVFENVNKSGTKSLNHFALVR